MWKTRRRRRRQRNCRRRGSPQSDPVAYAYYDAYATPRNGGYSCSTTISVFWLVCWVASYRYSARTFTWAANASYQWHSCILCPSLVMVGHGICLWFCTSWMNVGFTLSVWNFSLRWWLETIALYTLSLDALRWTRCIGSIESIMHYAPHQHCLLTFLFRCKPPKALKTSCWCRLIFLIIYFVFILHLQHAFIIISPFVKVFIRSSLANALMRTSDRHCDLGTLSFKKKR